MQGHSSFQVMPQRVAGMINDAGTFGSEPACHRCGRCDFDAALQSWDSVIDALKKRAGAILARRRPRAGAA